MITNYYATIFFGLGFTTLLAFVFLASPLSEYMGIQFLLLPVVGGVFFIIGCVFLPGDKLLS